MSATLRPGDPAPAFVARDHLGRTHRLEDYRGRCLVVFFYPQDGTPICTAQACAMRDASAEFLALGAAVIGVSSDDATSHRDFAQQHRLGYPLIPDERGELRRLFRVPRNLLGLAPGRVTYVIDAQGRVAMVYSRALLAGAHARRALQVVRALAQRGGGRG